MEKLIKDFEIPNKKIETWKFTDLNKVFEKNKFEPFVKKNVTNKNESTTISSNIKNNIFFNNENNFIIFENGYLKKINIKTKNLEIKTSKNNSKTFKKNFDRKDNLLEINNAFMNDNLTIKIKKNTKIKEPISIFYYNCEKNIIFDI